MDSKIPELFNRYFSEIYSERWPSLLTALCEPPLQIKRWNQFSALFHFQKAEFSSDLPFGCSVHISSSGEIPRDENNLLQYYIMDPASVVAAHALDVQPEDSVLDLCAAPGGKSLILAEGLKNSGELLANEFSASRRERLKKVIQQYIPRESREKIWVTGYDGGRWASQQTERFDRILVDAPCSGERHLLANPAELSEWSASRISHLAQRQYTLLAGAMLALKPGGVMVYSTCSISPEENDQVIAKLLKKKKGILERRGIENSFAAEETEFGYQHLPDKKGWGPIYFAKLQKS